MVIDDKTVHPKFKLNGIPYTSSRLKELAYDLVKEASPFERPIGIFLSDWLGQNPTIEVKTSGSTGTPKNLLLQKKQMFNSALATGEFFDLKQGDTALLCLPAEYIAGKMMFVRAMVLGLELDYVEPSSSPLAGISKSYDFAAMVPLQLENSLEQLDLVKTLIVGGAPLSKILKEEVQNVRTSIYETYGMTETISHIAIKRINKNTGPSTVESYFNTLPNVTVQKDGRDCLVINAPDVNDKPVFTNDIVNLISDTEFEWLGRVDNVINSGGVKLIPEQIELKLASILKSRFFVAGIPDNQLGQKLILLIEGKNGSKELLEEIKDLGTLSKYEIPKDILFLKSLIETENGKVSRKLSIQQILNS